MKKIKDIIESFIDFIYDTSIDIKDRTFVVFSVLYFLAVIGALLVGLYLKEPVFSTITSIVIVLFSVIYLNIVIKKKLYKSAKIIVAFIMVGFFQPVMFFTKGGLSAGALFTVLLGSYYLVLILEGRFRIIMCIVDIIVLAACWIIAYNYPVYVTVYTRREDYIYSFAKYIIISLVLTAVITFQTRIYQKAAKASEEKTKELEEMNKAQNRFFSSMSHEIRTPINTVLGLNEIILRQEDASDEIKKDARNIQGAGKMLLSLINDILDVSKIEAGKMDIVPVDYDVSALLSEIVNMIWLKAEEKGLKFNVDIDPGVPRILFGDEVRIKQILINLLNNAVKYTKEGSVSLHMECETENDKSALLSIVVEDTGMGIKPESLPHLFDTFQRVDEEKNRYIEGTGLGLSIVKQLVELMDGEITVNSVYMQGSTFTVTLRQGISSDHKVGIMNIANSGNISGNDHFEHLFHAPDASILIIDDNEMNLEVEKKLLNGTGIKVDTALSGIDALAMTLKKNYDLIFMDHLMPEMDGIECYSRIRKQDGGLNRAVPIIVLTANAGSENIDIYNNVGFDGYLVKPVSGMLLEEMIISHLPVKKVHLNENREITGSSLNTGSRYSRKKPVAIATSSMSDLPQYILDALEIDTIPYTVITNEGVFFDNKDIDSEELVRYMQDESKYVSSEPPTEDDLVAFFSKELKKAHHVIYITLTTGSSREYGRAVNAANTFEDVSVVNSECLSSATGILVMIAARLAEQNLPVERILTELENAKELIKCSFVVRSTDVMARRDRISPFMNNVLKSLWLRPMLRMKNDKLGVGRMLFGSEEKCYEKYIKKALPFNSYPDNSFVFVTYAGMEEEELLWIEKKLNEWIRFDHIIFQKASAGITSNCGGGTFGLIYMMNGNRNYNLGNYFENIDNEIDEIAEEYLSKDTGYAPEFTNDINGESIKDNDSSTDAIDRDKENNDAKDSSKWYENIEGLDPAVAIKNSGSEDAFLSVIKIYYDSYKSKSDEIQGYYDSENWTDYTVKVHALKSSSRLVGALKIGEDAEALENAGKNNDIDFIRSHHDALMSEYGDMIAKLDPVFAPKEDLPPIPEEILTDAYMGMSEFVNAMDYELSLMVIDSVKDYKLPDEDKDRFERINNSLSNFEWDEIKEILSEVLQEG